jgi:uncharacterized protein (TIGR02246 family)
MTDDQRLQQLFDLEAIKQLKARYFRLMDTKQWDEWAQVFTEDAVFEIPEGDAVYHGRNEIVSRVSTVLTTARTCHHGHTPEIELTGDDTARGVWAMFDYVEWPEKEDGTRTGLQGFGHYRDEYVRDGGGWRIAKSRLDRLRVDPIGTFATP